VLLQVARVISHKILKAETIGFIAVGVVYGAPTTNLLLIEWQESFMAIGYLGLILLVFEGALSTNIELLTRNISLSTVCAVTGVLAPIGLSMLLLVEGFGYTTIQAFAAGASLSATSLGTTVAVLKAAGSTSPQSSWFSASVTTVLLSAATIDDVIGLVMASVMPSLGLNDSPILGWAIGRPVLSSLGLATVTGTAVKLIQFFNSTTLGINRLPERHRSQAMFICIVVCLAASAAAASYSGTSILFGAFAAGILFSYMDTLNEGSAHGEMHPRSSHPNFRTIFQQTIGPVQEYLFAPLFFASIGFAIPFRDLWQATNAWHGITYALLMAVGKLAVGIWIPVWSIFWPRDVAPGIEANSRQTSPRRTPRNPLGNASKAGVLLGSGMVARGEIGLLIVQLGYDSGRGPIPYDLYIVAIWALVLNTIAGPILVAVTLSRWRNPILKGQWGISHNQRDDIAATFEVHEMPYVTSIE
jgi:Kef-type K+ transport system membrane component KefB